MLETLHISNYALIDQIDITFGPGLNIITGETGAGKSIMLGALSLIMGGRADSRHVRSSEKKSVIEATFVVENHPKLEAWCKENDVDWDDKRCILRREISPTGRSRAFVNDSPVPLSTLREVAIQLIDIHSQHQNLLLGRPEFQTDVIDTLAGNEKLREEHRHRWTTFKNALQRLKAARARVKKSREEEEYSRYQLAQLTDLKIENADEQSELERRRDVLDNLGQIKEALATAINALSASNSNAIDLVYEAKNSCSTLESVIKAEENIGERLESVAIELRDISDTLSGIDEDLATDPGELTEIENRLDAFYSLEKKHHVESLPELIEIRDRLARRLNELDDSEGTLSELEREARRTLALAKETAGQITKSREKAALAFSRQLVEKATPLGMKNLRCEVSISSAELSANGSDSLAFMFAFNKNQELMPVGNAASGGEISRLMLSIKSIIAKRMELPSIIFDEVDTGVSGDVANRMGNMMGEIGKSLQVIAITHLPQVAAMGSTHYKVYKKDDEDSTHTHIIPLAEDKRVDELAIMLSGDSKDPAAREAAKALLSRRTNNK